MSLGYTNLVPWSPPTMPLRAHFLQGALSEEKLAQLGGQEVATLSPTTRWEIHNISGVCGELWAEEGSVQGMGGNLSDCRLPGPGPQEVRLGFPHPVQGWAQRVCQGHLLLGWTVSLDQQ